MTQPTRHTLYHRIREILDSARAGVARSVNTVQVCANWLIGREIVEEEQKGKKRARYGEALLKDLSRRLSTDVGKGWSVRNLEYCRAFYLEYPCYLENGIRTRCVRLCRFSRRSMIDRFRTQCVRNHGSLADFTRICRGHTTGRFFAWTRRTRVLLRNRGHQICLVGSRTGAAIHQFAVRTIGPEQG